MSVEIRNETSHDVDLAEVHDCARFTLDGLHIHRHAELSVRFIDEDAMEALHMRWMDLPGPTDVMSFPMDELRPGTPGKVSDEGMLGDIVICPGVAAAQAQAAGHSVMEEVLLLLVHGVLHLLGYDHAHASEREEMFALQRRLLLTFLAERGTEPAAGTIRINPPHGVHE